MNTYHAFYKGKKIEIEAVSMYKAQIIAAVKFNAKKSWQVAVVLFAIDGKEVTHVMTE
jgi:hypothetical protein